MEEDYVMIPGSGTKKIIRDVKKETASKAAAKTTSSRKTAAKKTVASKAKKPAGKE